MCLFSMASMDLFMEVAAASRESASTRARKEERLKLASWKLGQACGNHFLEDRRKYIKKKLKNVNFKKTEKKMSAVPKRLRIQ